MNPFYNSEQRRVRAAWRLVLQTILFFGPVFLAGLVLNPWLASLSHSGAPPAVLVFLSSGNHLLMLAFALGSCYLAARFLDRRPFRDFGFHFSRAWWRDLVFGLALGAALMTGIFLVELAAGWVTIRGILEAPGRGIPLAGALLSGAIGYVLVGIYEELVFRGYQLRNLAEGLRWRFISPRAALLLAYLISSVIFGLVHQGRENATPLITPVLASIALFFGLGYLLTGELALPIGIHITWNFFQGCVFGFPVSGSEFGASLIAINPGGPAIWTGGAWGPEGAALGLVALSAGTLAILAWVRLTRGKVELQDRLAVYEPVLRPTVDTATRTTGGSMLHHQPKLAEAAGKGDNLLNATARRP